MSVKFYKIYYIIVKMNFKSQTQPANKDDTSKQTNSTKSTSTQNKLSTKPKD